MDIRRIGGRVTHGNVQILNRKRTARKKKRKGSCLSSVIGSSLSYSSGADKNWRT